MSTRHIYVIQMHTNSLPSRFVRLFTRYEYSHVAIALKKDCKVTYSYGRKELGNIWTGGFVEEYQNGEFFKKFNKTDCRIYEIEVTEKQYRIISELLLHKRNNYNNFKYDFVGAVLRYFFIPVHFENRAVCSQFVAEVLKEGRVVDFEKPTYFIRPKDFENCTELKKVYEGRYLDYKTA